jgi:hypothetical protein
MIHLAASIVADSSSRSKAPAACAVSLVEASGSAKKHAVMFGQNLNIFLYTPLNKKEF